MRTSSRVAWLRIVVFSVAWLLPGIGAAQTGTIAGAVKDATGAVLPGVTVEAASPALIEQVRTATTDGQGEYKIVDLRPGVYRVTFTLPGFATLQQDGVTLTAGVTANVGATLKVGALEETITVSGTSVLVDMQNTTQHRALTRETIEQLPTGRKWMDYAVLIPGVVATKGTKIFGQDVGGSAGETNTGLSIHGSHAADLPFILDGMRYGNTFGTGGQMAGAMSINNGMIEEIAVDTSGATAEADIAGVRANLIPRQGGNRMAGQMFFNYMNEHFQANNLDDALRARGATRYVITKMYDFNPGVGGPIKQNKLWYYASFRSFGNGEAPPGARAALRAEDWLFTPDPNYRPLSEPWTRSNSARITAQTSRTSKINVFGDWTDRCANCQTPLSSANSWEATRIHDVKSRTVQGTWNWTVTNRLLVEAGETFLRQFYDYHRQSFIPLDRIGVVDSGMGLTYRATTSGGGVSSYQHNGKGTVTYVTGSNSIKAGVQWMSGFGDNFTGDTPRVTYGFRNGTPISLTLRAVPGITRITQKLNLGTFVQEQWTRERLTLNAGVRFDYLHTAILPQQRKATEFIPITYQIEGIPDVPRWKDISPRFGASYDLFGDGRTALKWNLGRFIEAMATGLAQAVNPATANQSTTRAWTDTNGNFIADCDLANPRANGECRENGNANFGLPIVSLRYDPAAVTGWATRGYNWETMVGIQHALTPNVATEVSYHRRWFGNFRLQQNLLTGPADYDPFCVNVPTDARLGAVSGQQMCGLYNVKQAKFGLNDNVITRSDNFGTQEEIYQGVDYTVNARLAHGIVVQGGGATGRTVTSQCFVVNSAQELLFCETKPPLQTQLKGSVIYQLPWWGLQTSAAFQSLPGTEITATWAAPASAVVGLGRPLSGGAATVSVPLIPPGALYTDRLNQIDMRVAKNFRWGRYRLQGQVDFYNLLNDNTLLALNTTYGGSWQQPTAYLAGRMVKFGVQLNF